MKLLISTHITFNPLSAWPKHDLDHDSVMVVLANLTPNPKIPRYHFHTNDDGTFTPLMRSHEWQLKALLSLGFDEFTIT